MKNTIKGLFLVGFLALSLISKGQDTFTFRYTMEEMNEVQDIIDLKEHFLGEDIAIKFLLLKESYTYIERDAIAQSEKTVVEKPSIYYSCKKVSKYLKKAIKQKEISEDEAKAQMDNVLNIALNIRYQETEALEQILWDINKDPNQVIAFYNSKVKLEM